MAEPTAVSIQSTIGQFVKRYRAAVLARSLVLAVLSSVLAALLIWRLRLFNFPPAITIGLPLSLWLVIVSALAAWAYRHWLSQRMAAARLDKALGLQQRLVTAEEFAQSEKAPALYSMLMEDLARQCTTENARVPKKIDHSTGVLLAAILLLLLWPSLNQVLPPSVRLPEPPKKEKPPDASSQEQKQNEQQSADSPQSQPSSGGQSNNNQQSQPSGGNASAKQPSSQGSPQSSSTGQPNPKPSGAQQSPQSANASSGGQQKSDSGQSGQQQKAQAGGGNQSSPQQQAQSNANNAQQASGNSSAQQASQRNQASGSEEQSQKSGTNTSSAAQQGKQGQQGSQTGSSGSNYQSKAGGQSGPGQKQEGGGSSTGTGSQGVGQSSLNGEALKAEIQGLLKEVSGELKDLQQQINASDQAHPQAGTQTDPNVYGSAEPLDKTQGSQVAIQLKTDSAPTQKQRPAGGTGSASSNVASDGPQVTPEEAKLSNTPREETPASQQHVPAEYRGIFDQMRKQPQGTKQ